MSSPSHRMLDLLSVLQSRRDWGGQELADRLGVTVRTVRRDVDRLRELGYAITAAKGPYGGYRLSPGDELPPLLFDDEQAVAIAVALQSASGVDITDAAARALATLRQVMPSHLRHRIDGIRFEAGPPAEQVATAGGSTADVLAAAATAAREGAEATVPLVATKGRASYLGERSAGHQDPGATSTAILLEAARDAATA